MLRSRLKDPRRPPKSRARRRKVRRRRSRAWNLFWGVFFFVLGVIGVLVPIMPQVPFFLASLVFFSLVFPGVRRAVRRFLHRHPRAAHAYKKWRDGSRRKRQAMIRKEKELLKELLSPKAE